MRRTSSYFIAIGVLSSCGSPTERSSLAETESEVTSFCPPIPAAYSNVEITSASPRVLTAGAVVTIEGRNFDRLPANTVAWFYSNGNSFTATSRLFVLSPTRARAVVPSHRLVHGPGLVSLYYTECVDCTGRGGGPNECAGAWVNHRTLFPDVEFTHPSPKPLPVSHLRAVAVSDSEIQLSWQDNSNDEEWFEVLEGPDESATTTMLGRVARDQTSEPITGARAGTRFCYEVRAANASGYEPVPREAKACVTTLERAVDRGEIAIRDVAGFDNTLCPTTMQNIELRVFADDDSDGVVRALASPAIAQPAPAFAVPNVNEDPAWDIFIANRYASGANMIVLANISSCAPGDPQFVAAHLDWDGGTQVRPVFLVAGNYQERTGRMRERIGTVMIGSELSGQDMGYDMRTGRVSGVVGAIAFFHVEIPGQGISFDSRADVTVDFSHGVEVVHE